MSTPKKIFSGIALTTVILVAATKLTDTLPDYAQAACVCGPNAQIDNSLPLSHPRNRCADLSWGAWVTGNSSSSQMHFIDLLELLYGHESAPNLDSSSNNLPEKS
ncbi:hypothetical protein [Paraferrimonas haliotis]|uniref:hypothetical protein n=1 Tax=Paraferrimonas haliotis TaxID=2013866 RepID=UPI0015C9DB3A|nr:hypothetical protein [Paraferrimonas haliotis]